MVRVSFFITLKGNLLPSIESNSKKVLFPMGKQTPNFFPPNFTITQPIFRIIATEFYTMGCIEKGVPPNAQKAEKTERRRGRRAQKRQIESEPKLFPLAHCYVIYLVSADFFV